MRRELDGEISSRNLLCSFLHKLRLPAEASENGARTKEHGYASEEPPKHSQQCHIKTSVRERCLKCAGGFVSQ